MKKLFLIWIIALLIALLGTGCSFLLNGPGPQLGQYEYTHRPLYTGEPKRIIPIWVDKNFSTTDQKNINQAVETWNMALNGHIKLEIVDTQFDLEVDKITQQVKLGGWLFMKVDSDNYLVPIEKGAWTLGFTERVGGNHLYLVRDRISNDDVFGITLHEIGHLMGSGHVGKKLMYPHFTRVRYQCIDWDTILTVANYHDLPVGDLNFCVDKGQVDIPVHEDRGGA